MKKYYTMLLFVIAFGTWAQCQTWRQIQVFNDSFPDAIVDATFWGDTGLIIGYWGQVVRTNNLFSDFEVDSVSTGYQKALYFLSRDTGYLLSNGGGGLRRTVDGGRTWYLPLWQGPVAPSSSGASLLFVSPDTGFATSGGTLSVTFDGGVHWNDSAWHMPFPPITRMVTNRAGIIYAMCAGGIYPSLFRSADYCNSWQNLHFFSDSSINVSNICDFTFLDDSTIIAMTAYGIMKSTDTGFTFRCVMPYGRDYLNGVGGFINRTISFCSHDTGFAFYPFDNLYRTYDAGETWVRTNFSLAGAGNVINYYPGFVRAISPQKVVLGLGRSVFITTTGGGVWSGINEVTAQNNLALYPNPATKQLNCTLNNLTAQTTYWVYA
ncbi:MAG TPA: hypothetical protein VG603_02085, partial [Chitinophagales bacterium]|nr:hypothetical protein [Chitinophagales bacterium]